MSNYVDAIVVGGGIVGLSIAYRLSSDGYKVIIVDEQDGSKKASYANAGYISPSLGPISLTRGGLIDLIKWYLFNGKVKISKDILLSMNGILWLKEFIKNREVSISNAKAIREMALYAIEWYKRLSTLINFNYKVNGLLEVYSSSNALESRLKNITSICNELNIRYEILSKSRVKELEPRLKKAEYAIYYPEDAMLNPKMLMSNLRILLSSTGVRFLNNIKHIEYSKDKDGIISIAYINADGADIKSDYYILCTGAYRVPFKHVNLPIMPARGYAIDIRVDEDSNNIQREILEHAVLLGEHRIALAPFNSYMLRASGFFELTSIGSKVRDSNFSFLYKHVNEHVELGNNSIVERWIGYRPCTPDNMPIICRYNNYSNLIVAVGHCRLGVTLAPYTAELVYSILKNNHSNVM
jgi:D-amino-acid dehydrogenase